MIRFAQLVEGPLALQSGGTRSSRTVHEISLTGREQHTAVRCGRKLPSDQKQVA